MEREDKAHPRHHEAADARRHPGKRGKREGQKRDSDHDDPRQEERHIVLGRDQARRDRKQRGPKEDEQDRGELQRAVLHQAGSERAGQQQRHGGEFGQKVVRLLARDEREEDKPRQRPDQAEPRGIAAAHRRRQGRPDAEGPYPRKEQDRQQRHQEPDRAVMRQPARHPRGGLRPEQFLAVGRGAADDGGDEPERDHGERDQEGKPAAPRDMPDRRRIRRPEPQGEKRHGQMDKDHRPLGVGAKREAKAEERPGPGAGIAKADAPERPDARDDGHRQHAVEHRRAAIDREDGKAEHDEGGASGDTAIHRPEAAREARRHGDRAKSEGRSDEAGGELAHPGDQPDEVDEPEKERRLVGVEVEVPRQVRDVAGQAHFPCDVEIAGLVDRQERPGQHLKDHQQREERERQRQCIANRTILPNAPVLRPVLSQAPACVHRRPCRTGRSARFRRPRIAALDRQNATPFVAFHCPTGLSLCKHRRETSAAAAHRTGRAP